MGLKGKLKSVEEDTGNKNKTADRKVKLILPSAANVSIDAHDDEKPSTSKIRNDDEQSVRSAKKKNSSDGEVAPEKSKSKSKQKKSKQQLSELEEMKEEISKKSKKDKKAKKDKKRRKSKSKSKKSKGKKSKKKKGKKKNRRKVSVVESDSVQAEADKEFLENPKLDLADADVLGIQTVTQKNKLLKSPPLKGGNSEKVAKIIRDHLIHKQAIITINLLRNFKPVHFLMQCCGLFPMSIKKEKDGTVTFSSKWKKFPVLLFFVISALITYTLLAVLINSVLITEDLPFFTSPEYYGVLFKENQKGRILIDRHIIIMTVILIALLQSFASVLALLFRRKRLAEHFTDWTETLLLIQMDVTSGAYLTSTVIAVTFALILLVIIIMAFFSATASVVGGPLVVGILTLRQVLPWDWMYHPTIRECVRLWGLFLTLLIFVSSKAPILFFMHQCKLLKNGFSLWNARLYNATLQSDELEQSKEERTTYGILYEDYFNLIRLKEDMDKLCSGFVEAFLCLQPISVSLEVYLFVRALKYGDRQHEACEGSFFVRPLDWVPGILLSIISILFLHTATISAIELGEEIQSGLEIIRRSTMLGKKKEEELFFMASLFSNYTEYNYGTNFLQGMGFFFFDRETHGALMTFTIALALIIFQFSPKMDFGDYDYDTPSSPTSREAVGKFLQIFEYLPANHWKGIQTKC